MENLGGQEQRFEESERARGWLERGNLELQVVQAHGDDEKWTVLRRLLDETPGPALIFTASPRSATEVRRKLQQAGIPAERLATRFVEGETRALVLASGSDARPRLEHVRLVVHWTLPDSLETYVRESSLAGTDGAAARAVLLYRAEERRLHRTFGPGKGPRRDEVLRLYYALRERRLRASARQGIGLRELGDAARIGERRAKLVAKQLADAGVVTLEGARVRDVLESDDTAEVAKLLEDSEARQHDEHQRLQHMMAYGQTALCRTRYLARAIGVELDEDCGHCDNCASGTSQEARALAEAVEHAPAQPRHVEVGPWPPPAQSAPQEAAFAVGTQVRHERFGVGEVIAAEGDVVVVEFPDAGSKRLRADYLVSVQ